ncbi:MAG: cytochrome c oxidase accessory protein CcoG [Flammeovirgaceae bacterium]|nr:cytochrome c oxidase accessory protein CcoG [Flammeovirgaceae bacterium]MBR09835.1 cytochrome c oxidase accessory protein CcoG [Rickettsiales bacterium]HCX20859.1 cytochrome c oxidase accessory protein CcoG [Cytophagales bacterium]
MQEPTITEIYDEQEEESYRDHISTVDDSGKRVWLYPKKPKGRFTNYRQLVSYLLLGILFAGPFIKIEGQPLLKFDIIDREFVIFGQVFWPQDFHLAVIGMITTVVFIILFTVVYGRIFCGWICPQTIFMEHVFRRVEFWIEGDYMKQKKLDKQEWNTEKVVKKTSKHIIFLLISAVIMHTFVAYIVGVDDLWAMIGNGPAEEPLAFVAIVVFTGLFYGVFSKMREQVCTTICPYGRLQGVLLDRQSIVVAYDHVRGETRGKIRKGQDREEQGLGDCIDCHQCVYVCPTGIDIRNGTQLECVNCTACIDACDSIMDKVGKPRGLVRYASEDNIAENKPSRFTGRMKAYTTVLFILIGVLVTLLYLRSDVETTILRTPGMMYQEREDGTISNLYQLKMVNKTAEDMPIELRLEGIDGKLEMVGDNLLLKKQGLGEGAFFIVLDPADLTKMSTDIQIGVYSNGEQIETVKTRFLGPAI